MIFARADQPIGVRKMRVIQQRGASSMWIERAVRAMRGPTLACAICLPLAASLVACGTSEPVYVEKSVEVLYNEALDAIQDGRYSDAYRGFEEVERQHPYSPWATKAQLMAAYSYYVANKNDDAILAASRFIQLHPGHRDIAYAYYIRAISDYERIADVGRDQAITQNALASLREVELRFPGSDYARDARLKIDLALDHLAGKEMHIGRYYLTRGHYGAAVNRFRVVIENYQTTTHVAEALHRLTEAYLALGVQAEAQTAAAVLGYNYPGSDWYRDSYVLLTGANLEPAADERSWISRTFSAIF